MPSWGWASLRSEASAFGGIGGGDAARDAALTLYPKAEWRSPTQIKLHRAAAEADAQDAVATLAALSDPQRRDHGIRLIAMRVLVACEAPAAGGAAVAELREVLAA